MSILTDELPTTVRVAGREWAIRTEHFIGIRFELLIQAPEPVFAEKIQQALSLYYPSIPPDVEAAVDALLWFYRCGEPAPAKALTSGQAVRLKAYDYDEDAGRIYAAFRATYGIDLATETLHWWQFQALFHGLPAECEMKKIMSYRCADLSGLDKTTKKHYEKMRRVYALRTTATLAGAISLAERDKQMKDYVASRLSPSGRGQENGC